MVFCTTLMLTVLNIVAICIGVRDVYQYIVIVINAVVYLIGLISMCEK